MKIAENSIQDAIYDNIRSRKKPGLHPFFRICIVGKKTGGGNPPPPATHPSVFRVNESWRN